MTFGLIQFYLWSNFTKIRWLFIYDTLIELDFFVKMYTKDFADIRTPEKSFINTRNFKIMSQVHKDNGMKNI